MNNHFTIAKLFPLLLFLLIIQSNIQAQTIQAGPCSGNGTLQDAINTAVANDAPNQTILVDPSMFTNASPGGNWGLSTLVGAVGNNLSGLTIDGQGSYIDATAAGLGFFDVSNIDNLTIRNFTFDGFNRSTGSLVLDNCDNAVIENVIFANGSTTQPVVISAVNGNTSVTFNDCAFIGNPTSSDAISNTANSGAVQITGDDSNTIDATFNNTRFRCNGRDGNGGAVQISGNLSAPDRTYTTVSFNGCSFENNNTTSSGVGGGAIYATTQMTLNVTNSNFSSNIATGGSALSAGGGGAIMINSRVSLNVDGCYFYDNSTSGGSSDGGAIGSNAGGTSSRNDVVINNSVFAFNGCVNEGGACFFRHANVTMTNSLFLNNNTPDGGAFHIENAGTYNLDGITITGTSGSSGMGIENNSGTLTMNNSILVDNSGANITGTFSGSNNTTSGSVTFTNPMPGGATNPATYNYDVTGTQGSTIGVLSDISSDGDCSISGAEAVTPPASANPCDALGIISGNIFHDNYGDGTSGNNDGTSFTTLDGTSGGMDATLDTEVYLYSCTLCDGSDNVLEDRVTSTGGSYEFMGVGPGTYFVSFDAPAGFDETKANTTEGGADGSIDSDITMNESHTFTVDGSTHSSNSTDGTTGASSYSNISAGFYMPITVEGTLFSDENFTVPAAGETFTVTVTYDDGSTASESVVSDGSGNYQATGFPPGLITSVTSTFGNIDQTTVIGGSGADGTGAGPANAAVSSGSTLSLQDFALPVELVLFEVSEKDCQAQLEWMTATEENSSYFAIERSWNGRDFEEIMTINAAGQSMEMLTYQFTDREDNNENVFYRLRMVDLDGSYEYSKVISFRSSCQGYLSLNQIYPNPAKNTLNISLNAQSQQNITVTIYNSFGMKVKEEAVVISQGNTIHHLQVTDLSKGVYFLQVNTADGSISSSTHKFTKH